MTQYADSGDYTWYTPDTVFDHIAANPPRQLDNERLSELVSGGGALLDVPPVVAKDASNTVFVPERDALRTPQYETRTCHERHTEEMGRLWAALVHLQRRVEELEAFNTPGK